MNQVTAESLGKTWIENLWRIAENSLLASRASPERPAVSVRHLGSRQKTFWPNLFEEHSLPRAQQAKLGEDWAPTPLARPGLIRALLLTTQYYSSSKQSGDQNTAVDWRHGWLSDDPKERIQQWETLTAFFHGGWHWLHVRLFSKWN